MKTNQTTQPYSFSTVTLATLALAALLIHFAVPSAQAATYYWDNDGTGTTGFGTAGGTWSSAGSTLWSGASDGGTDATLGTTVITTPNDVLNFGTATDGLGLGTITLSGTNDANSLTFGSASGAITLQGTVVGDQINIGGTTPTVTVNNTTNTIKQLSGTNGFTKAGSGTLILTPMGTSGSGYDIGPIGTVIVNAGILKYVATANAQGVFANYQINNGSTLQFDGVSGSNFQMLFNDINASTFTFDSNGGGTVDMSNLNAIVNNAAGNKVTFTTTGGAKNTLSGSGGTGFNGQGGTVLFNIATGTGSSGLEATISLGNLQLEKSGAGVLTLTSPVNVVGATSTTGIVINASGGTVEVGNAGRLNSGTFTKNISIGSGGTLYYNSSQDQTLGGTNSGAGGITKANTSQLTLTNSANSYSGATTINGGTLRINTAAAALSPNTAVTVASGGQLYLNVNGGSYANNMNIAGGLVVDNFGAIRVSDNTTLSGPITLSADARIGGFNASPSTISGRITGSYGIEFYRAANINSTVATTTLQNAGAASDYTGNTTVKLVNHLTSTPTNMQHILKLGANDQIPDGAGKGNLVLNGGSVSNLTVFDLNGFSETINGLANTAAAGAKVQNTNTGASTLTLGAGDATGNTFSGVITDGGVGKTLAITKTGSGTQTFSGANTYSGDTTISAGTLLVNNTTGSGTGLGNVTVNSAGALGGTGTLAGVVTNNGTLAPGASIGTLTISSNLVLNAGSTNTFEVDGSTPTNDVVVLGASVTYGGVLKIVPTGTFTNGQSFTLFSGAGATNVSNFASIAGSPGGGNAFSFTNGVLTVVSTGPVTPSPATLTNSYSGGVLTFTWPALQGWRLVNQTNSRAIGLNPATNAWFTVPGGVDGSNSIAINPANPTVFFRLVYP